MYLLTDENLKKIDLWFQCYVDMADGKRWSDRDRICYMSSAIKSEEVLDWFQNLRRKHRESFPPIEWSFEQWRKELTEVFGRKPTEESAFMEIEKGKWVEGEKPEVYFRDMLRLCREADRDMSEKEKIRRIKAGMLPNKETVLFMIGAKAFSSVKDFLAEVEAHQSVQDLIQNSKDQQVGSELRNQYGRYQKTFPAWQKTLQNELGSKVANSQYPYKPNVTGKPFKSYMSDGKGGLVATDVGSTQSNSVTAVSVPVNAGMADSSQPPSYSQAVRQNSGPRFDQRGFQQKRVFDFDKDKWKLEDGTPICRNCNGIDHISRNCPDAKRSRFELTREPTMDILLKARALAKLRPVQTQSFFANFDMMDNFLDEELAEYFDMNSSEMETPGALVGEVVEDPGFDTGAATSIVPLKVAQEVGADVRDFLPHWPDTTLTSIHNVHKKVDRTYTQLSVTIGGITHKVPCFVEEGGIDKIILGTDYLEAVGADISFRKGTITIPTPGQDTVISVVRTKVSKALAMAAAALPHECIEQDAKVHVVAHVRKRQENVEVFYVPNGAPLGEESEIVSGTEQDGVMQIEDMTLFSEEEEPVVRVAMNVTLARVGALRQKRKHSPSVSPPSSRRIPANTASIMNVGFYFAGDDTDEELQEPCTSDDDVRRTNAAASQVSNVDQTASSLIGGSNPRPITSVERFAERVSRVMARQSDPVQGQIGGSNPRPASRRGNYTPTRSTAGSQTSLDRFFDTQVQTVAYDSDPDPRVQGFFQRVNQGRDLGRRISEVVVSNEIELDQSHDLVTFMQDGTVRGSGRRGQAPLSMWEYQPDIISKMNSWDRGGEAISVRMGSGVGLALWQGLFPGNLLTIEETDSRVESMFAVLNQGREYHDQITQIIVDGVRERGESSQDRLSFPTLRVRLGDTVISYDTGLEHSIFPNKRFRRNEPDDSDEDLGC